MNVTFDAKQGDILQQPPAQTWLKQIAAGALAGMIGAVPMGLIMIGLNRVLSPRSEPPKLITRRMMRRIGLGRSVRRGRTWDPTTWAAHLGYGAATASLYPVITRPLSIPRILRGMVFALGVWAMSYLGWLPAAHILPPANKQPARRNIVMILSHLAWGSLIGILTNAFERKNL